MASQSQEHRNNQSSLNNSNVSQPQHHQHQHLVNHRTSNANQKHNDDDDIYQDDHGMRVGNNYQAEIPQFIAYSPAPEYYEDEKAIRVWSPHNKIPDHVLDEYINKAKDKFYYNAEQALGMLSWHKFDLNRAIADLPNFVPLPNEWSVEDKVLFEQAYQFHEKQFSKIKQMLPDKSMANLINYYYSWKKTRTRASLMERQTRRFNARTGKTADSNGPSDEDEADNIEVDDTKAESRGDEEEDNDKANGEQKEDSDEQKKIIERDDLELNCCICSKELRVKGQTICVTIDGGDVTNVHDFCPKCYIDYKAGSKEIPAEPELGDCFYHPAGEHKRILFQYSDVLTIVDGDPGAGDVMLKQVDTQIHDIKRGIQTNKQTLSQINEKIQPIADQISDLNMNEFSNILPEYKPNKVWTADETQMVIMGVRRYGTDFSAISDILRTKSPENIKQFYVQQGDRLGLKTLVAEFETNKQLSSCQQKKVTFQKKTNVLGETTESSPS